MTEFPKKSGIIALLFTGVLMGALDISIVGPAIPSIEKTISIEPRLLGWIFSIYILFNLTGISLFARLSDIFGRKIIYIISVSLFALGSLIVSLSEDFTILLIGRAVQGFASGGFFPVASAVVGDVFPQEKRGRILGMLGMVFGIAFIIGPVIAGVLLRYFEWNILFLINIPIAIIIIIGSLKILPNTRSEKNLKIDWGGIIVVGLTLGLFAYSLNSIDSENFIPSILSHNVLPYLSASILLFILAIFIEKKASAPIIKTELFFNRQIRLVGIIAFATGAMQSTFVFIPDFTVDNFDVMPSVAGFMLLPIVISTAIGSPLFGRLIDSIGSKKVIILGLILSTIGFYMLNLVETNIYFFYASGIFIGLGLSILSGSSLRYIMLNEVGSEDRAVTQGLLTIFVSLGQLTGAAIIGVIIASFGIIEGYKDVFLYLSMLLIPITIISFRLRTKAQEINLQNSAGKQISN